jgi:NADH-quinone oxidoreductase subunit L
MGSIVVCTLVLIAMAYSRYVSKAHVPASDESQLSGLHKTVLHKYYVDEIYDAVIVKPLYWLSKLFDIVIEKSGIDKIVNLTGDAVNDWSRIFRLLQNGSLGYYIFVMVIGVILIVGFSFVQALIKH